MSMFTRGSSIDLGLNRAVESLLRSGDSEGILPIVQVGEPVLRLITGSSDARIISNAMLYLKISVPIIPPMAVLVILRNMLQGIRHTVEPLLASALELIGKVIFAVWLVPVWGYRAVCFCEPTTWIICFVFILLAVWRCRSDLQDACPPGKTPA